jgi:hypothetical protein
MRTQDEVVEAAKKAAARSHRINQFCWGWFWCGTLDVGLRMIGAQPTEMSPYLCLAFFVIYALLALHFQKKVFAVGFSYSVGRK